MVTRMVRKHDPSRQENSQNNGFWRLEHEHLAALLALPGLSWRLARIYIALADLTHGRGKPEDVVAISQIATLAHVDRGNTYRALKELEVLGLYAEVKISTKKFRRRVIWPPPIILPKKTPVVVSGGNNSVLAVDADGGNKFDAPGGKHQEKKVRKTKKGAKSPPAPKPKKIDAWAIWVDTWREERPGRPGPTPTGPNTKAGKELAKLIPDPVELTVVFRLYLRDSDPFPARQGHALKLLPGRVDAYRGQPAQQHEDPTAEQVDKALGESKC